MQQNDLYKLTTNTLHNVCMSNIINKDVCHDILAGISKYILCSNKGIHIVEILNITAKRLCSN